jgi:polyisoprenyl-phosphate glycosyltransferase
MISVVIPTYRPDNSLLILVDNLLLSLDKNEIEIIIVLDSSDRRAWLFVNKVKDKYPDKVLLLRLSKSFGQHNATICGMSVVKGDFVVTIDDDMQQNPHDIKRLIEKHKEMDYDVVYGFFKNKKHSFWRNYSSNVLRKLLVNNITDLNSKYSSFRLMKSFVAKDICQFESNYSFIDGYISWITNHTAFVELEHIERHEGQSSYTLKKLFKHFFNIILNYTSLPVTIFSFISMFMFLFSSSYAVYIVFRKIFFNDLLSGFPTILAMMGFGFAFVLLGLSLILEYLLRVNRNVMSKPKFVILEIK